MLWAPIVYVDTAPLADGNLEGHLSLLSALDTLLHRRLTVQVTLAVTGQAFESVLDHAATDPAVARVLDRLGDASREGRLEWAPTAFNGAILPLLPLAGVDRQLRRHTALLRRLWADGFHGRMLVPPALAMTDGLARSLVRLGMQGVVVDPRAIGGHDDTAGWRNLPEARLLAVNASLSAAWADGGIRIRQDVSAHVSSRRPARTAAWIDASAVRGAEVDRVVRALQATPTQTATPLAWGLPVRWVGGLRPAAVGDWSTDGRDPFRPWHDPRRADHAVRWQWIERARRRIADAQHRRTRGDPQLETARQALDRCAWGPLWSSHDPNVGRDRLVGLARALAVIDSGGIPLSGTPQPRRLGQESYFNETPPWGASRGESDPGADFNPTRIPSGHGVAIHSSQPP